MESVYLDELFCLDLAVDYFLLMAAARLCALPYRRGRYLAAAALGGLWNCLGLLSSMGWLLRPVMRLALAVAMTLTAFGGERRLGRCLAAFLAVSALFGGAVYAAGLIKGDPAGPLLHLDMRVLALAFAVCWAGVSLLYRGRAAPRRRILAVTVRRDGRSVALRALEDTGNGLTDPLTGRGALIAEAGALEGLFPPGQASWLRAEPSEAALHLPGARLIPYAGLEGQGRLLLAFLPDDVTVEGRSRDDLLAAVVPGSIGSDGTYDAIL